MIFEPRQRIVMIGDSITGSERREVFAPYGYGHVSLDRTPATLQTKGTSPCPVV